MLPSVVSVRILKLWLSIFILQVKLVSRFECHISSIGHFMSLIMDLFVQFRVRKVLRFGNVFGDVGNKTHVLDIVEDVVVIFRAVFLPYWREAFNHDVIVHVGFDLKWFASVCEHILFYRKDKPISMKLVKPIAKLFKKHLLAVLLQKVEISISTRKQNGTVNFEKMLENLSPMHFHSGEDLLAHEPCLDLVEGCTVDEPGQVDTNLIPLECGGVFRKIIGQKVVIIQISGCLSASAAILAQVIVVVIQEVWLNVGSIKVLLGLIRIEGPYSYRRP